MDDQNPFGEPDMTVTCSQDAATTTTGTTAANNIEGFVNLETHATGSTELRPYLFDFKVVDDDKPREGTARKAMTRFLVFKDILRDPELLEEYGIEFRRWFKDKERKERDLRKETHVALNYGSFHIAPDEESTFLERYAVSIAAGRPFWMIERPTPVFRLFFDMDFKNLGPLTGFGIEAAALVTGRAVAKFFPNRDTEDATQNLRMIVCCTDIKKDTIDGPSGKVSVHKTGVHIHWPNVFVTGHQAMTIRETVIADLIATFGPRVPPYQNQWHDVIDSSVFYVDGREGSGLRMYASRKADKCPTCKGKPKQADGTWCKAKGCRGGRMDSGRPYVLLFATDGSLRRSLTQEDLYLKNLHSLIVDVSIRCHKDVASVDGDGSSDRPPSEGFVLPPGAPLYLSTKHSKKQVVFKGLSLGATTGNAKSKDVVPGSLYDTLTSVIRESFGHHYKEVVVSSAKQQMKDKAYIVNVTGQNAHYCQNIQREHKSNRIYFLVSTEGIVQRCYDPSDNLSEEMRFGLCKTYASTMFSIAKRYRDILWPKATDDSTSLQTSRTADLVVRPAHGNSTTQRLKILYNYGDFLCQKLYGSAWSATLQLENNQKLMRSQSASQFLSMGPDDLGLRARAALVSLGFQLPNADVSDQGPRETLTRNLRFEKPLSDLEDEVWTTFRTWVLFVVNLEHHKLQEYIEADGQVAGLDMLDEDLVDETSDAPLWEPIETPKASRKRSVQEPAFAMVKKSRLRERLPADDS